MCTKAVIFSQIEDEEELVEYWAVVFLLVKPEVGKVFQAARDSLEKGLSGKARLGGSPDSSPIDLA